MKGFYNLIFPILGMYMVIILYRVVYFHHFPVLFAIVAASVTALFIITGYLLRIVYELVEIKKINKRTYNELTRFEHLFIDMMLPSIKAKAKNKTCK